MQVMLNIMTNALLQSASNSTICIAINFRKATDVIGNNIRPLADSFESVDDDEAIKTFPYIIICSVKYKVDKPIAQAN